MVRRPVFVPDSAKPYVSELSLDFEQYSGSSIQQKQRSIASLHASYVAQFPSSRVLEVSSKSERDLGVQDVEVTVLNVLSRLQKCFRMVARLLIFSMPRVVRQKQIGD